ncbi:MAG: CoA transferase [Firmicutes bacterium]|nr:CoA transferase [Bacillota bacterium]
MDISTSSATESFLEGVHRPLEGLVALELGGFITAPYAGLLLAEMGARVIKVEPPGQGDPFRAFQGGLYSPQFQAYNRNKESLCVDLKHPEGRTIFYRLVETADVVVQNFRPGTAATLGVAWTDLARIRRDLVYCSITGFGSTGPYGQRPSYDTVAQAFSGLLSMTVDPELPRVVGPAFADGLTGLYAAYGILAALFHRHRTGAGMHLEITMLEATMAFLTEPFSQYFYSGYSPGPLTRPQTSQSYAFVGSDGKALAIHLSSPEKFWNNLLRAIEAPQLATDPRFATREARLQNYLSLHATLAPIFAHRPRAEWLVRLEREDVPAAPIYSIEEVVEDPQVRELAICCTMEHPEMGKVGGLFAPIHINGERVVTPIPPPVLGEQTERVLEGLGYSSSDILALRQAKVIYVGGSAGNRDERGNVGGAP